MATVLPSLVTTAMILFTAAAPAQWPTTSSPNLPIGDSAGEQTLAKVATTRDGGCWIGWFDNRSGTYAVYLQHLDPAGNQLFPPGGILVSGNPQSTSLVDWELLCDRDDHCVLAFTDTRAGGDLDVYAYRIAPDGTFVWGANGIPLSNNFDFEPNPRICQAGDDDLVFVWTNTVLRTVQMQRVSPAGTVRFAGDGVAIPGEPGQTPGFARVVTGALGTGDVIVSWVRATAFSAAKHIHMQKYDALGNPLWNGGTRLAVFDQASLPIAHDPKLLSDQQGGAVVSWHFAQGTQFFARVQHLDGSGTEVFAHDGVNVTTSTGSTFDPAAVWLPATSEILVAWNERNLAQSNWGIFAQKLDAAGVPQWGPAGVTLLPIDTTVKFAPVAAPLRKDAANDGLAVSVLVESLGLGMKSVQVFGLTNAGAPAFPPVVASTFASDKLRLAQASTPSGTQLLAWTDARSPAGADIFGAAVDLRGQLGVQIGVTTMGGCTGQNPPGSLVVTGRPAVGTSMNWQLTNPLGTQTAGSTLGIFVLSWSTVGFPCGVAVPGLGMGGPGATGEVFIDLNGGYLTFFAGVWSGVPTMLTSPFAMPFDGSLVNLTLYLQGVMVDLAPAAPVVFGFSEGARLVVGS